MTTKITRKPADVLAAQDTSVRAVVARILDHWNRADSTTRTAGATWYHTARVHADTIAESAGIPVDSAAAVIAHLSPRTRWARNVAYAYALVETGTVPQHCIGSNADRARSALASDDPIATLHGPKTRSFALNILGDENAVTVDVWALRIALGYNVDDKTVIKRAGVYDAIAHCYRLAAKRAGVSPATMQATTWIVAGGGIHRG